MSVSVERIGNEATLKITAPAAAVADGFKKAVAKIANEAKIPGFRKGKAPRKIVEMYFGKEAVIGEAYGIVANKAYTEALVEQGLVPVSDPTTVEEETVFEEGKDLALTIKVTLKPEPELGEYKGLQVEKKVMEVTDEAVEAQVQELRNRQAKMVVAPEGTVIEKGDFAIIDFAGTVDGEPFSGGEGKGYPLEVGSGSFIPGFEDQLVGLSKGDSTDVDVTFPEEYFVAELAGKQAIFKVNIQDVKRKELPELTDEYVAANSDYKTIEEMRADYKVRMEKQAEQNAEIEYRNKLIETAVANAKFEVPAIMIEDRVSQMIEEMSMSLEARKMKLEQYLQYTGMTMEQLRENQRATAEANVKTDLVLDAIAKAEGLNVTEADEDAAIADIANQNGAAVADVKKIIKANGTYGLLRSNIRRNKAANLIIDSAAK